MYFRVWSVAQCRNQSDRACIHIQETGLSSKNSIAFPAPKYYTKPPRTNFSGYTGPWLEFRPDHEGLEELWQWFHICYRKPPSDWGSGYVISCKSGTQSMVSRYHGSAPQNLETLEPLIHTCVWDTCPDACFQWDRNRSFLHLKSNIQRDVLCNSSPKCRRNPALPCPWRPMGFQTTIIHHTYIFPMLTELLSVFAIQATTMLTVGKFQGILGPSRKFLKWCTEYSTPNLCACVFKSGRRLIISWKLKTGRVA